MEKMPNFRIYGKADVDNEDEKKAREAAEAEANGYLFENHLRNLSPEDAEKLKQFELPKTAEDLEFIAMANEATNALLKRCGIEPFDISDNNFHKIDGRLYAGVAKSHRLQAKADFSTRGIYFNEDLVSESRLLRAMVHFREMLHLKSYLAYYANAENDVDKMTAARSGMRVFSTPLEQYENFRGLDEAIVAHEERNYLKKLLDSGEFEEEKKDLFSKSAKRAKKEKAEAGKLDEDEIYLVEFVSEWTYCHAVSYKKQRNVLDYVCKMISEDTGKSERDVHDAFLKATLSGGLLDTARLVENSFGKGGFRELGEMGVDDSTWETVLHKMKARRIEKVAGESGYIPLVKKADWKAGEEELKQEIRHQKKTNPSENLVQHIKEKYFSFPLEDRGEYILNSPRIDEYARAFVEMASIHSLKKVEKRAQELFEKGADTLEKVGIEQSIAKTVSWAYYELARKYSLYSSQERPEGRYILDHPDPLRDEHLDNVELDRKMGIDTSKRHSAYDDIANYKIGKDAYMLFLRNSGTFFRKMPKSVHGRISKKLNFFMALPQGPADSDLEMLGKIIVAAFEGKQKNESTKKESREKNKKEKNAEDKIEDHIANGQESEHDESDDAESKPGVDIDKRSGKGDLEKQQGDEKESELTAEAKEKTKKELFATYFSFQDIQLDAEATQRILGKRKMKNECLAAFMELQKRYSLEEIEKKAKSIKKTVDDVFAKMNIKTSRQTKSISWVFWDIAQQYHFFLKSKDSKGKYDLEKVINQKEDYIMHRTIGHELYMAYKKNPQDTLKKIPDSAKKQAEVYLSKKPDEGRKMISIKDLIGLGFLVLNAVRQ